MQYDQSTIDHTLLRSLRIFPIKLKNFDFTVRIRYRDADRSTLWERLEIAEPSPWMGLRITPGEPKITQTVR
jgi:hypothetical protein